MLTTEARVMVLHWACTNLDPGEVGQFLSGLLADIPPECEARLAQWRDEKMIPAIQAEQQQRQQLTNGIMQTLTAPPDDTPRPLSFDEARARSEASRGDAEQAAEASESDGAELAGS